MYKMEVESEDRLLDPMSDSLIFGCSFPPYFGLWDHSYIYLGSLRAKN